jgi:diaminopimelate decarboxylase
MRQYRSNRQIISHGQKVAARWNAGIDVFDVLRRNQMDRDENVVSSDTARNNLSRRTIAEASHDLELQTAAQILCAMKHSVALGQ